MMWGDIMRIFEASFFVFRFLVQNVTWYEFRFAAHLVAAYCHFSATMRLLTRLSKATIGRCDFFFLFLMVKKRDWEGIEKLFNLESNTKCLL